MKSIMTKGMPGIELITSTNGLDTMIEWIPHDANGKWEIVGIHDFPYDVVLVSGFHFFSKCPECGMPSINDGGWQAQYYCCCCKACNPLYGAHAARGTQELVRLLAASPGEEVSIDFQNDPFSGGKTTSSYTRKKLDELRGPMSALSLLKSVFGPIRVTSSEMNVPNYGSYSSSWIVPEGAGQLEMLLAAGVVRTRSSVQGL